MHWSSAIERQAYVWSCHAKTLQKTQLASREGLIFMEVKMQGLTLGHINWSRVVYGGGVGTTRNMAPASFGNSFRSPAVTPAIARLLSAQLDRRAITAWRPSRTVRSRLFPPGFADTHDYHWMVDSYSDAPSIDSTRLVPNFHISLWICDTDSIADSTCLDWPNFHISLWTCGTACLVV